MGLLSILNSGAKPVEAHVALSAIALLAYIGFQVWAMALGEKFSPEGFAFVVSAILGGGGAVGYAQGYLTRSRAKEREIAGAFPGVD